MPKRAAASRLICDLQLRRVALQVAGDVGKLGQGLELLEHARRPGIELVEIGVLSVYWYWPREMRPPTVMSCEGCRKRLTPSTLASCGRSRLMTCTRRGLALVARLEADEEAAGIERVAAAAAEERSERGDVGIARDDLRELALQALHLVRRDVLRGLRKSLDQAGILGGKEALRDGHEQDGGHRHRGKEHHEGERLMAQHHVEHPPVAADQRLETPFDRAVDAAMMLRLLAPGSASRASG